MEPLDLKRLSSQAQYCSEWTELVVMVWQACSIPLFQRRNLDYVWV